jgi:DMSO reductase anchor subunit
MLSYIIVGVAVCVVVVALIGWARDQMRLFHSITTFSLDLARMQFLFSRKRMIYWLASLLLWDIIACFAIIFYHFPRGLPFSLTLLALIMINICCLVVITTHYQLSRLARQRVKALEVGDNYPGRDI